MIRRIMPADPQCGFRCGVHPLDDYFRRHALSNDEGDIGCAYVLEASAEELEQGTPKIMGFYTLSMSNITSREASVVLGEKLPRYPMPVALIGRLAVDERVQGRRLGEQLLIDALARVVAAGELIACLGVVVDAKDERAEQFYLNYDFVTVDATSWPHRMFLPMSTARAALSQESI